jgi:electron transfer flavoprotein alpha subunit
MNEQIHVYIDQADGKAQPASWEALGAALALKGDSDTSIVAVVLGQGIDRVAQESFSYGADSAVVVEDEGLAAFSAEVYAGVLSGVLGETEVVLFSDSERTRDLAAMVAVDLETGLVPDVTALERVGERIVATRPIYAGKLLSRVEIPTATPKLFTLRSRAFTPPASAEGREGEVHRPDMTIPEGLTEIVGVKEAEGAVSLTDAAVIVSGGRGIANNPRLEPPGDLSDEKQIEIWKAHQGFELVRELAQVLGGAVGASRAAVDAGYIPYAHQVGQTGRVVTPDLYIACGISGAIQHLAGMRSAKTIVAVNSDPDAPIFKLCRFVVVGDLHAVLPALTDALRESLD